MSLKDLVPPLELCKLIPTGEFEDSACIYVFDPYYEEWDFAIREDEDSLAEVLPAPTLQEIMMAMPYCRVYKKTQRFFVAVRDKEREVSFNGATAALKLWLNLKGIEYGE